MFIEFTFNPRLLFILIFPISKHVEKFISDNYLIHNNNNDNNNDNNNLFKIFKAFLSKEFAFIFLLIIKCKSKSSKKEVVAEENDKNDDSDSKLVDMEIKNVNKKNQTKSILFLFLLSILYFCSYSFNYFVDIINVKITRNSIGIIYEIIILYILSRIILKEKYFKHHYLSVAPICISLIIIFIIYLIELTKQDSSVYNAFWYFLVYYSLFGLFNVLIKKYFLLYFHSIYFVTLIIGAFVSIPILIYDIIRFFIKRETSDIIIVFADKINTIQNFFLFIIDLIFLLLQDLGIFWTVYYFTPFHLIICEFIYELINYYVRLIQFKIKGAASFAFLYKSDNIIIFSVLFFINLICSLIFNEIIILKFCKLEFYTKKYIKNRAELDVNSIFIKQDSLIAEIELMSANDN